MKWIGFGALGVIAFIALYGFLFGMSFAGIRLGGVLKAEQARVGREVYEETLSFNRGLSSNFERQRQALELADSPGQRSVVCASMLRQFAADTDRLTLDQQAYYRRLQSAGCQ